VTVQELVSRASAEELVRLAWCRVVELEELDRRRRRVREELVAVVKALEEVHGMSRRAVARELGVNESTLRHHITAAEKEREKEGVPA